MLKSYIAFDLETTGLSPQEHEIIEIGALKVREGKVVDRFMEFVHPDKPITPMITNITHITNHMVAGARSCPEVIHDFLSFCEDDVLIGHNVMFDYSFVKCSAVREGLTFEKMGIDTLKIAKYIKTLSLKVSVRYATIIILRILLLTAHTMMHSQPQSFIRHWHTILSHRIRKCSSLFNFNIKLKKCSLPHQSRLHS